MVRQRKIAGETMIEIAGETEREIASETGRERERRGETEEW